MLKKRILVWKIKKAIHANNDDDNIPLFELTRQVHAFSKGNNAQEL